MVKSPTAEVSIEKIPVGISSCLLGEKVRFDGGHKQNAYIMKTLGEFFEFLPFCPEVSIGLGVPRETIRLVAERGQTRCRGTRNAALDVTDALIGCADEQRGWHSRLYGYILKKDSPSCGMERVRLYTGDTARRDGVGLYTRRLMANFPNLPIEEEGRLGDPVLRENFVQRVLIYRHWRALREAGPRWAELMAFHARHKLTLMSRDQNGARALGRELAEAATSGHPEALLDRYEEKLMALLKLRASRGNHVNVLQHIQGYLKIALGPDDKAELTQTIDDYRRGLLPLIVPITLLRHHFRKCPDATIDSSHYMNPHPRELMLLNHL